MFLVLAKQAQELQNLMNDVLLPIHQAPKVFTPRLFPFFQVGDAHPKLTDKERADVGRVTS